jgi:hypothetical protein
MARKRIEPKPHHRPVAEPGVSAFAELAARETQAAIDHLDRQDAIAATGLYCPTSAEIEAAHERAAEQDEPDDAPNNDPTDATGVPLTKEARKAVRGAPARHAEAYRRRAGIVGELLSCICTYPLDVDQLTVSGHDPHCPSEFMAKARIEREEVAAAAATVQVEDDEPPPWEAP